ncbi:hypothetical protein L218DRAFT_155256 [Marasmius fiardii PR-910]|nr:hypothetical protein L218DRAFT_155256 [Marasmius fiardii PR-910]
MNSMIKRVENSLATVVDEATDYLTNAGVQFRLSHSASQGVLADAPQSSEGSVASLYTTATESSATETTSVEDGSFDSDSTDEHVPRPSSPIPTHPHDKLVEPQSSALQTRGVIAAHTARTSLPSFPTVDISTLSLILNHVIAHLETTYTALLALHSHLSAVLVAAKHREKEAIMEAQARDDLLEIRGRRKAWLGKGWGLARSQGELVKAALDSSTWRVSSQGAFDLAMPFRPSGLGKYTWTCEEWEHEPWYCFPGYCSDPKRHHHQNFDFLKYREDEFNLYYVDAEEEEEDDDDDGFSLSSSNSSLRGTYQYQSSGVAYEDHPRTPPLEYSPCARIRRSLDESIPLLCDETFPETILSTSLPPTATVASDGPFTPDLCARRASGESDSTMEHGAANSRPQMEPVTPFTECFTNPFDEEDKALVGCRRSEINVVGGVTRRHHRDSFPEDSRDTDSDSVISSWTRSSTSSSSSSRTRSRRQSSRSSVGSTVFFPVSEEEFDEEVTDRMLFTVSVDVRDNPVFSPETPRSRKSSMPNDYFGLDLPRRASDGFPTSPISPTTPTSGTPNFEHVVGHRSSASSLSQVSVADGESAPSPSGLSVGITVGV